MQIAKEATVDIVHGHTAAGTTRAPLNALGFTGTKFLLLKASEANIAPIWIGGAGVLVTDGAAILPGDTLRLPIDKPESLYVISTAANQDIAWMLV